MGKTNNLKQYPVDKNGNFLSYPSRYLDITWITNNIFEATMKLNGVANYGRTNYIWTDESGKEWSMFPSGLLDLLNNATVVKGKVTGLWRISKNGSNYGLQFVAED